MPTQWTPAGEFRHRVEVQENRPARDAIGGQVDNWTAIGSRWAKVTPLSGRAYLAAKQAQHNQTHQVNLRYWDRLAPGQRLLFKGRALYVNAVLNLGEMNRECQLDCSEGTP